MHVKYDAALDKSRSLLEAVMNTISCHVDVNGLALHVIAVEPYASPAKATTDYMIDSSINDTHHYNITATLEGSEADVIKLVRRYGNGEK